MIRSISLEDIAAIRAIYNHYIKTTVVSFEEEAVSIDEMSNRVEQVQALDYPWLVAEEAGRIIGYAYATVWNVRSAYKHTVLVTVYLSPDATGKGWGSKLYEALFEALKKRNVHVVIAGIAMPNQASVALHEKLGFNKIAHFSEVGFKFDQWVDVAYWQAKLD